jgi:hypothetical protein
MNERDELESGLTRALERAPMVAIPEGFALRVAALVPRRRAALREIPASNVGTRVAVAVAAVLLAAICVLAHAVGAGGTMGWLEIGLAIEFATLTAWLGLRQVMGS